MSALEKILSRAYVTDALARARVRPFLNLRIDRNEIAGATGDLGTFIIFLVGLVAVCGFDPAAILIWAGMFNILTGVLFGIPMAVQPMKAIGIIAISLHLSSSEVVASGLVIGAVIFLMSLGGLFTKLLRYVPGSVGRGIQLGLGLMFMKAGFKLITDTGTWLALDSYAVAITVCVIIFLLFENRKVPPALIVFAIGFLIIIISRYAEIAGLGVSIYVPKLYLPGKQVLFNSGWKLVLPQLPLTITNSLIATAILAKDYFPEFRRRTSINNIALSVGFMNLLSCLFGGMPMCHGAGGMSAQYRFGARTGGSVFALGVAKVLLGLFFGTTILFFAKSFPGSILGVMMIFGGVELATHVRDMKEYRDVFVMVLVAGIAMAFNMAAAFVVGLAVAYYWKLQSNGKHEK